MAIFSWQMVTLDQIMLPYLQTGPGRTLYLEFAQRQLALPAPKE